MTTAELIEKLERADGPSRELDEAIYELMGGCNHKRTKYYAVQSDTGVTCLDCGKDTYGAKYAPSYTASIDAAMTLVPEGFRWALGCNGIDSGHPVGTASVFSPEGAMFKGSGATPAIALCIAALKAKEADNG